MQHLLPFFNNSIPIWIPEDPFKARVLGSKSTPTKRRLITSHLPILEPVLKPAPPSPVIQFNLLPRLLIPHILWTSPKLPRFCDTRFSSFYFFPWHLEWILFTSNLFLYWIQVMIMRLALVPTEIDLSWRWCSEILLLLLLRSISSVCHEGLFYKPLKTNIGGNLYNLINSL